MGQNLMFRLRLRFFSFFTKPFYFYSAMKSSLPRAFVSLSEIMNCFEFRPRKFYFDKSLSMQTYFDLCIAIEC